jgi:DNA-binding MarR family transcriptional regulator
MGYEFLGWGLGQSMNKEEQLTMGFRNLYNKMLLLNKDKMEDSLKGYKSSEVHCIEYIGKNADCNVTKLAESFYMTKGAISKLTKKLIEKGVIDSYQKPDNKKEVYFRLTQQGEAVFNIHEELHKEFQERDKAVFEQITEEQFASMLSFVEMYSLHLDAEIKKQSFEMKPDEMK